MLGAREVNDAMPQYVFDKIHKIMKENNIKDYSKVGLYGLTYKENVDDMRESPTLQLLDIFEKYNVDKVKVYDPFISEKKFENQVMNLDCFLSDIELVVVLVSHDEIKSNQELLKDKVIYDTRNIIKCGKKIYKI